ncbi:polysaccharide pyruvyl transferase CsaB [Fictibacillus sp. BK138]|uniref:polysaccharide pyruvyl transferase CsaB n=1 Tax=Fictibacillus sp. BK138 TaxID=2512121 RepID=UPI001028A354|nr:polysaccharide pyruvyl transferase CsaB [Fictibacillus sp. BK138]RZT21553.1 polysaccharide pyruvyl transferase CsaB [Fictibacillus sp. BK138]
MKVVLSGYYGFNNIGDEAILLSIISALKEQKPDIEIVVLSNDPEFTKRTYGVDAINRWQMKDVFAVLKTSDGLISGGGSLLQDKTGMKSIPYYTGIMMLARMAGKPFFIYSQGMGPIDKSVSQFLTRMMLKKAGKITLRDTGSIQLLKDIGLRNEMELVPDPVLGFHLEEPKSNWYQQQDFTKPVLTVSVREWPTTNDFKKKIAEALDDFIRRGNEVVFIPMHDKHDDDTSREILAMMNEKAYVAPFDASIEEKVSIIGLSDMLLAMRLHALIFAGIMNTPFLALSYDPKIDAFSEQANQPVFAHVDGEWTSDELALALSRHLEVLPQEKEKLAAAVGPLTAKAKGTAKQAIELFARS